MAQKLSFLMIPRHEHHGHHMPLMVSTLAQQQTTTVAFASTSLQHDDSISPTHGASIQPIVKSLLPLNTTAHSRWQQTSSHSSAKLSPQHPSKTTTHPCHTTTHSNYDWSKTAPPEAAPESLRVVIATPLRVIVTTPPWVASTSNNTRALTTYDT